MLEIKKNVSKGCPKALKEDGNKLRCIQKGPQKASKARDPTGEIQRRSQEGPQRPQRSPRGQPRPKSIKFLKYN